MNTWTIRYVMCNGRVAEVILRASSPYRNASVNIGSAFSDWAMPVFSA